MGVLSLFKRKKPITANERRMHLLANGRITDGVIIDHQVNPDGTETVFYEYTLNGVDFESSEILTPEQCLTPVKYAPGAHVGIRYDTKNQGNSIVE